MTAPSLLRKPCAIGYVTRASDCQQSSFAPFHNSYRTVHEHHNVTTKRPVILCKESILPHRPAIEGEGPVSLSPSLPLIYKRGRLRGDDDCPSGFAKKR